MVVKLDAFEFGVRPGKEEGDPGVVAKDESSATALDGLALAHRGDLAGGGIRSQKEAIHTVGGLGL